MGLLSPEQKEKQRPDPQGCHGPGEGVHVCAAAVGVRVRSAVPGSPAPGPAGWLRGHLALAVSTLPGASGCPDRAGRGLPGIPSCPLMVSARVQGPARCRTRLSSQLGRGTAKCRSSNPTVPLGSVGRFGSGLKEPFWKRLIPRRQNCQVSSSLLRADLAPNRRSAGLPSTGRGGWAG